MPDPRPIDSISARVAVAAAPGFPAARAAEALGLFLALPLLMRWGLVTAPRLVVLGLVTASCVAVLWNDSSFDRRRLFALGDLRAAWRPLARRALLAAVVILVLVLAPRGLFAWPRQAPLPWLAGLAIYPFLSAWPQEVVFRVYFFHRYQGLFPTGGAMVLANALAFGVLHCVYPNPVAPLLSVPAGLLLALTYRRTGTMGSVWLEHVAYGLLLFTLGLGDYFYDGRP